MATTPEFQRRMERIEILLKDIEDHSEPDLRARAADLVQALLDLYGAGLATIVTNLSRSGEPGRTIPEALASDDLTGSLLLLHGLHPVDLETRIRQAIEGIRPRLFLHGGRVELLAVDASAVRLELHAPSDHVHRLRQWLEEAICAAAPDVSNVLIEESPDQAGTRLLPLPLVGAGGDRQP